MLFTVYMDILLNMLKDCDVGCYWDGMFVGALGYADDIILLAPCPSALRLMLKTCESFASSYGLKFNASKTQLIRFRLSPSNLCNAQIYFCGQLLEFCNSVCHLGHYLTYDLSDNEDIVSDRMIFLKRQTYFFYNFKFCSPSTLTFLLHSFCLSLYGCALWRLDSKSITSIEVAFNKVLRRIWNLPFNSYTRIVHCTAHLFSIFNLISARSSSLLFSALSCLSFPVTFIFRVCSDLAYTTTGFSHLFGNKFKKIYYPEEHYCADVIRNEYPSE